MNRTVPVRGWLFALAVTFHPSIAGAAPTVTSYLFENITHSNAASEADGEANLKVDVIDLGGNQVRFNFTNNSSSSLADVYFDDGALLGIASITSSAGVSFSQGDSPPQSSRRQFGYSRFCHNRWFSRGFRCTCLSQWRQHG